MSFRGYQSTIGGEEPNEWSRLSQTVATNVQKISQNVNQMQRMVNQLGTTLDSEGLRSQLHNIQLYTNQLVIDTDHSLKSMAELPQSSSPSEQKQRQTFINNSSEVLKSFEVMKRIVVQKERQSLVRWPSNPLDLQRYQTQTKAKTVFGGTNLTRAARLAGTTPYNLSQRHLYTPVLKVNVKPSKSVDSSDQLSTFSKRILEKLEKASTPLQDAKRTPYYASAQLKDYFQSSNYLHRSAKRPKLGPPTATTPIPSLATIDHRFKPQRFELRAIDDNNVSSTEPTDQFSSTSINKYSSIDSKDRKTNESFGGKMMRKDLRREERRPKTQTNIESSDIDLGNIEPLTLPPSASLPTFTFAKPPIEKKSTKTETTTTTIVPAFEGMVFKFSEPLIRKRVKNSENISKNESVVDIPKETYVFGSPPVAIPSKPISSETTDKESKTLKEALEKCVETTGLNKDPVFCALEGKEKIKLSKKTENLIEKWICVCLYHNICSQNKCKACGKDRDSLLKESAPTLKADTNVKPLTNTTPISQNQGWGDKFKAPSGVWNCGECFVNNNSNELKCLCCEAPKPADKPMITIKESPKSGPDLWECFYCNEKTENSKTVCNCCEKIKTRKVTKSELAKLYGEPTFKFGTNDDKSLKKYHFNETKKPIEDKTDFSNKLFNNNLFNSTENTTQKSTSVPISKPFVFGSTTSTESPKLSLGLISSSSTTSASPSTIASTTSAEPLFKFGANDDKIVKKDNLFETKKPIEDKTDFSNKSFNDLLFSTENTTQKSTSVPISKGFVFGSTTSTELPKLSSELKSGVTTSASTTTTTAPLFKFGANDDKSVKKDNLIETQKSIENRSDFSNKSFNNKLLFNSSENTTQKSSFIPNSNAFVFGLTPSTETPKLSLESKSSTSTTSASTSSIASTTAPVFKFGISVSSDPSNDMKTTEKSNSTLVSNSFDSSKTKSSSLFQFGAQPMTTSATPTVATTTTTTVTTTTQPFTNNWSTQQPSQPSVSSANQLFSFGGQTSDQFSSLLPQKPSSFQNSFSSFLAQKPINNSNSNTKNSSQFSFGNSNPTTGQTNGANIFGNAINQGSNSLTFNQSPALTAQKPLNSSINTKNSSQFSFGNSSTGQTNSSNIFGNAINQSSNSLSFNQSSALTAPANTPFAFGGFGSTQSTPSVPQIQSQLQQPLPPPPAFNFSSQPSFDFSSVPNTGVPSGGPVFQFSAEQPPQTQAINRITKKAKRRLNPT